LSIRPNLTASSALINLSRSITCSNWQQQQHQNGKTISKL
jgi:hypothetical protein